MRRVPVIALRQIWHLYQLTASNTILHYWSFNKIHAREKKERIVLSLHSIRCNSCETSLSPSNYTFETKQVHTHRTGKNAGGGQKKTINITLLHALLCGVCCAPTKQALSYLSLSVISLHFYWKPQHCAAQLRLDIRSRPPLVLCWHPIYTCTRWRKKTMQMK